MNNRTHQWITDFIEAFAPCSEAREHLIETNPETPQAEWDISRRGDWMLWVLVETRGLDNRTAVKISCRIVREVVWKLLTDERSRRAVEVAERWLDGTATIEDVRAAAYAADAAAYAAADAAYAAADAAYAAYAADAAYAAADAAYAAARAAYAAYAAVREGVYVQIADIVRKECPICPNV